MGLFPKSNQSKVSYYDNLSKTNNSPFICLTETHLKPNVINAEIQMQQMTCYRTDRITREGGGVISYMREDLAVSSELNHSNAFCDSLGLHKPDLELALVTVYRPPKCPQFRFKECLEVVRDWLKDLELGGKQTPTILISGDFNLGFLNSWDPSQIEAIKGSIDKRSADGKNVAEDKLQAKMLIEFVEEHFLQQHVKEATRKENILDLIFTNNQDLIVKCNQIQHSKLSDHKTNVALLSYNLKPQELQEKVNFATTAIPEYNTAGADDEDWLRASKLLDRVNWEEELKNLVEIDMANQILNKMEDVIIKTMHKKHEFHEKEKK